ncbi:MAG: LON peptidase substrate-binding domain-containing protein, partial [Gammaproteobacteria bacterium]
MSQKILVPVLPLRDVVVYPHMVIPLFVGRQRSVRALDQAMAGNKQILLVAQKSASEDNPGVDDIHRIGTLSNILQLLKLPDGTVKVLVEGGRRAQIKAFAAGTDSYASEIELLESPDVDEREVEVLSRSVKEQFEQYVKLNKKIPAETA